MSGPATKKQQTTKPKKTLILNAFENAASGHQFRKYKEGSAISSTN